MNLHWRQKISEGLVMSKYLEFNTPATKQAMELASDFRLKNQGLTDLDRVFGIFPMKLCMRKLFSEMKEN